MTAADTKGVQEKSLQAIQAGLMALYKLGRRSRWTAFWPVKTSIPNKAKKAPTHPLTGAFRHPVPRRRHIAKEKQKRGNKDWRLSFAGATGLYQVSFSGFIRGIGVGMWYPSHN